MLKIPAFISNKVERNGDNCILTLTTKQAKLVAIIGSVVLVLALVLGIWGIVRQAEVVQLRQQTQLQSEQLKLLQQKTEVLDKKIQNLNQISEENKKMLKGAESPFGSRVDPVTGAIGAFHEGIDIADDYGSQIVATAAGVVTFAGYTSGGYGNLVEIDHGNGFVTRYGHNSAVLVTVGMSVKQGQTIALMGSTGKSTGAHVHYEVRLNNTPVDPMIV